MTALYTYLPVFGIDACPFSAVKPILACLEKMETKPDMRYRTVLRRAKFVTRDVKGFVSCGGKNGKREEWVEWL